MVPFYMESENCVKGSILVLSVFLLADCGGIYPETTWILLAVSSLMLFGCIKQKGYLRIKSKNRIVFELLVAAGAVISGFAGIDRGESIYGVIRLLTVMLVSLCLQQMEEKERDYCLKSVPYAGALMIAAGIIIQLFPFKRSLWGTDSGGVLEGWFSKTGRLAGPFSYPNALAMFLILGVIVAGQFAGKKKWIFQAVLCVGIFWTGSRTAFVLFAGYLVFCTFRYGKGSYRMLLVYGAALAGVVLVSTLEIGTSAMGRFLTTSLSASTFQGRLLYWEDACRMIVRYPFGLGYMGYFYMQQIMQTGVYSVRFVHNEWLQFVLDYGVFAGAGGILYCVSYFREPAGEKEGNGSDSPCAGQWKKEAAGMILLYSFFDFHLQFWGILFWLLMLMSDSKTGCIGKTVHFVPVPVTKNGGYGARKATHKWLSVMFPVCSVLAAGILASSITAEYYAKLGDFERAVRWNPLSTEYRLERLLHSSNLEEADLLANDVLQCNEYIYAAYEIKSNAAAQRGDIRGFVDNRKRVLQLRKYDAERYHEYFQILYSFYSDAGMKGDDEKRQQCMEAMKELEVLMENVKRSTSARAFRIADKPQLYWKKEYQDVMRMLKGEENE